MLRQDDGDTVCGGDAVSASPPHAVPASHCCGATPSRSDTDTRWRGVAVAASPGAAVTWTRGVVVASSPHHDV